MSDLREWQAECRVSREARFFLERSLLAQELDDMARSTAAGAGVDLVGEPLRCGFQPVMWAGLPGVGGVRRAGRS